MVRLLAAALALGMAAPAAAAPFVVTLDGTVSFLYGSAPSLDALGLVTGSPLHYEILVDPAADGFYVQGGDVFASPDVWNAPDDHEDHFYAELLSQPYPTPGSYYDLGREFFVGVDDVSPAFPDCDVLGRLFVGTELFHIDGCAAVASWSPGLSTGSLHGWHDPVTDAYVQVQGSLTVTGVTIVPEPATGLLLALGLSALARVRARAR